MNEATRMINEIFADILRHEKEATERAAQENPKAYRNCQIMERGKDTSYRYYAGPKTRSVETRYCYSKHRNVAGYYLSWVERIIRKGKLRTMKRTAFTGHASKQEAIEYCRWRNTHPEMQAKA